MEFDDLQDLKNTFKQGKFELEDEISVSGITYRLRPSPPIGIDDMIKNNYKGIVVYAAHDKDNDRVKEAGLQEWILMLWAGTGRLRLVPFDARTMTQARVSGRNITEDMTKGDMPDNIIGSTVEVNVTSLPGSGNIRGKIDTGATICSLHADKYNINREANTITFISPELSQNELTVPLVDQQSVKSADGGSEYRPVIELNIKINGKLINKVKFNLNDRSHMEFPMLVGKNALTGGKFLIDPRMDESNQEDTIDWTALQQEIKDEVLVESEHVGMKELYAIMSESDITFSDIVHFIRNNQSEDIMEHPED